MALGVGRRPGRGADHHSDHAAVRPETFRIQGRRIDYRGIGAAGLMMVSLVYGLSRLAHGPGAAVPPLLLGLAAGVFFVWWEQHTDQPALDLRIFRAGPFNAAVITGLAFNFLLAGRVLLLGYYTTVVRGYAPTVLACCWCWPPWCKLQRPSWAVA
ncbi:major facilitator superfamily MFS_1 domain protein [Mycobacterium kansasii]|uniref:Major facilitator superfamily MFS_1 domain protein n=1 Tax=Mycobacterium kansasii TaxID=1768 RepID=A0A1V3WLW5_MYCKA|nr:major facilitator superfamily MFS_1 domain protein [Mycobacterium kansasii]